LSTKESNLWPIWKAAVLRATSEELRYAELKRGENWIVSYRSPTALLELTLHAPPGLPEWRLTAFPPAEDPACAPSRKLLASAVARLVCKGSHLLEGDWSFALPFESSTKVSIRGVGAKVPSYEMRLGLLGDQFKDKHVFAELEVSSVDGEKSLNDVGLDKDISGRYRLLDKCGTANNALHQRIEDEATEAGHDGRPLYLFLDPTRTGDLASDSFVFSRDKRRLEYLDSREIIAKLSPSWRQHLPIEADEEGERDKTVVECQVLWTWIPLNAVKLEVKLP
jgi:hypothetical protein